MMYVAAVSLLSSSPLSLITAISFFFPELPCLHHASEKPLFFHATVQVGGKGKKEPLVLFFSFLIVPPSLFLLLSALQYLCFIHLLDSTAWAHNWEVFTEQQLLLLMMHCLISRRFCGYLFSFFLFGGLKARDPYCNLRIHQRKTVVLQWSICVECLGQRRLAAPWEGVCRS